VDEKDRLLHLLEHTRSQTVWWIRSHDGLVVYPDSGWTLKDVLAHLMVWERECCRSIEAFHQGGTYSIADFGNVDAYNARAYAENKDVPYQQLYAEWTAARENLLSILQAIKADAYSALIAYPSGRRGALDALVQEVAEHERDHMVDFLRALRTQAHWNEHEQFIKLLDIARWELEEITFSLSSEGWETIVYTESGWRVKDLVAHIIVWEQEALLALKAYHNDGEYIIPGYVFGSSAHEDAFNARVFEKCHDWDMLRISEEMRAAHSDLNMALAVLPDDKLNGEMMCAWGARSTVSAMIADLVQHERNHTEDIKRALESNQ
jgi:hypothetical protein